MIVILDLPFPPPANNLFANARGGGRIRSARYRSWSTAAGWDAKSQKPGKIAGDYELDLTLGKPDARKRDISNLIKAPEDLLVELGIVEDDSRCIEVRARWGNVKGCRVIVREAPVRTIAEGKA